jgi:hypothetical protein
MINETGANQISPAVQEKLSLLNARITNVNLANADLVKDVSSLLKALADEVSVLKKENADLKAKQEKTSKS